MNSFLIVDDIHPLLLETLTSNGLTCVDAQMWDTAQILAVLPEYDGLVQRTRFTIDKTFLNAYPNLRCIARAGAGVENIDIEYAQTLGVEVLSSPEGNRDSVAEHTVGMLLALLNKLLVADAQVRQGIWQRNPNWGTELMGKTIALIGYGYMGQAVAQRLQGFGVSILAHDKYVKGFGSDTVAEATLDDVFTHADVVSLHLPLTAETTYYANNEFFSQFKKPIVFINTARGKNCDTAALVAAMQQDRVVGACLDVLEYEGFDFETTAQGQLPKPYQYLAQNPNVVFSPHVAGWTNEAYRKHSSVLATKIVAWYRAS